MEKALKLHNKTKVVLIKNCVSMNNDINHEE